MPFSFSPLSPDLRPRIAVAAVWLGLVSLMGTVGGWSAWAQPPGTEPPRRIFDPKVQSELPVKAFIFLDESENPVLRPGTTWEEFEQVMDQISGRRLEGQRYVYRSLRIKGDATQGRASFEIDLEVDVDATAGTWVSVPLELSTFYLTGAPVIRGPGEHRILVDPSGKGYQLQVRGDRRSTIGIHLDAVAQVSQVGRHSLELDLPPVPTLVELSLDDDMTMDDLATVEVTGRGDEVVQTRLKPRPMLIVESNGVSQTIRWGESSVAKADFDLIEVDTSMDVRWDSPQDQPIASVEMAVRNLRGAVDRVALWLPPGAIALDLPRLGRDGVTLDWESIKKPPSANGKIGGDDWTGGQWFLVNIPEQEQQQRVSIDFELQLAGSAGSEDPLRFQVPRIQGAIRHRGEVAITTGSDFRLRWRRSQSINRIPTTETLTSTSTRRLDRFGFDRQEFELPLWLADQQREIRMSTAATMTIRNGLADLEMQIRVSGRPPQGQIRMNDAGWEVLSVTDGSDDQPLESFQSDSLRTIELGDDLSGGPLTIRLSGQRPLANESGQVAIPIPSVTLEDQVPATGQSTLDIIGVGRTRLVVDLTATEGLTRVGTGGGPNATNQETSRFRVNARQTPAVVIGDLVDQPPRISLVASTAIELDGPNLSTDVVWNVRSPMDLEGRLPIRFSQTADPDETLEVSATATGDQDSSLSRDAIPDAWSVTVDGVPAIIREVASGDFEVVSERLSSGTFTIDFRSVRPIGDRWDDSSVAGGRGATSGDPVYPIPLPRPSISDITLDQPISVTLSGNDQFDLSASGESRPGEMRLDRFPLETLSVRLRRRTSRPSELSIRDVRLLTVVSPRVRHEHLMAQVSGGNQVRFRFRGVEGSDLALDSQNRSASNDSAATNEITQAAALSGLSVQASVDGIRQGVTMDSQGLFVELPGDASVHTLSLKVWQTHQPGSAVVSIEPMLMPPSPAGRVQWQLVAPAHWHNVWASSSLSSLMAWKLDRWRLQREPIVPESRLFASAPGDTSTIVGGNQYVFTGMDVGSFEAVLVPRSLIWLVVAAMVLGIAVVSRSITQRQQPLLVIGAALALGGLMVLAPDAAVMAGQVALISLVLVVVMMTVRTLIQGESRLSESVLSQAATAHQATRQLSPSGASAKSVEPRLPDDEGGSLTTTAMQRSAGGSSQSPARGI